MNGKKSILITGCSDNGAGSALASVFHDRGFRVFATSRQIDTMSKLQNAPDIVLLKLDVTVKEDIQAAADSVAQETGGTLDYLINCAGRNHFMPLLDDNIDDVKALYDTNVWGVLAVVQRFAPMVIKAKGSITLISSVAGYLNVPYQGSFSASKRSAEIMAETLRLELAPFQVKVLSIVTGALKTMGQAHFDDWKLPDASLYKQVESVIHGRARGMEGAPRMDPLEYADRVVTEITKGASGKFWYGASAGAVKFGANYLPQSLMDKGVQIRTGLDILSQQGQNEDK